MLRGHSAEERHAVDLEAEITGILPATGCLLKDVPGLEAQRLTTKASAAVRRRSPWRAFVILRPRAALSMMGFAGWFPIAFFALESSGVIRQIVTVVSARLRRVGNFSRGKLAMVAEH
jgi:hypothetical protein